MKKFELTKESVEMFGRKFFRIKAFVDFGKVKAGTIGGYVEREENLSQSGDAWVSGNALVYGDAHVYGDAEVSGNAKVYGNARVSSSALVYGNAHVYGNAEVSGNANVSGDARVSGNARVSGSALVYGDAEVSGNAKVYGDAKLIGDAMVGSNADYICFKGFGSFNRNTTMFRTKNGSIAVSCGCFFGTLQEFEDKVKATHGDSKFAREYLACVSAAKIHFEV